MSAWYVKIKDTIKAHILHYNLTISTETKKTNDLKTYASYVLTAIAKLTHSLVVIVIKIGVEKSTPTLKGIKSNRRN